VADRLCGIPDLPRTDLVVSLAGITDVDQALRDPGRAFAGNINIAIDLCEWVRRKQPGARVIHLSSDEVLGESRTPLPETAPLRPTQPYAASKAAAELIINNYKAVYSLDLIILRSCNLIGGRQRARKLIPVAVDHLTRGEPVPVYGSGDHLREWMAAEDLCAAILCLVGAAAAEGTYQAASGIHLSIRDVIGIVAEALGLHPTLAHVAGRAVHDVCYAMDASRLRELGWETRIDPRHAIANAAREMGDAAAAGTFRVAR
jgi:dTDP-glucose 4,6-dehydratase